MVVPDVKFGELPFALIIMIDTQRATTIATETLGFDKIIHNDTRTIWVEYVRATHCYPNGIHRKMFLSLIVGMDITSIVEKSCMPGPMSVNPVQRTSIILHTAQNI